uniref:Putative ixoderin b5 n=1 Tax=Ixodes ricinus TaxID=34613 RepID=V5ICH5_IXORI
MFVAFLFIPVLAGNVFMESSFRRVPEITERQYGTRKTYMLFDPCNTNKRNENLHALTNFPNSQQYLRIELTRKGEPKPTVVLYRKFQVGPKKGGLQD